MNDAQEKLWDTMAALMEEVRPFAFGKIDLPLRELLERCPPQNRAHWLAATSVRCTCGALGSLATAIAFEDDGESLVPVCGSCGKGDGLVVLDADGGIN